uniref:Uncharacterized protein n=1 Tax=Rhizophora mucronata TaxID=61149 RepID=A0A2P2IWD7_RHIMU
MNILSTLKGLTLPFTYISQHSQSKTCKKVENQQE